MSQRKINQLERKIVVLRQQVEILMEGYRRALAGCGKFPTRAEAREFIERARTAVREAIQSAEVEVVDGDDTDMWIPVADKLPQENVFVDVFLSRGLRCTDCFWRGETQDGERFPRWYFPSSSVWMPVSDQDIAFWRYPPDPPARWKPRRFND